MELSGANDWGGQGHDSPTPRCLNTKHLHTTTTALDSSGHSCGKVQWGQRDRGKAEQDGGKITTNGGKRPWKVISRKRWRDIYKKTQELEVSLYSEPAEAGSQTQRPPQRSHSISSSATLWQSTTACTHGSSSIYSGRHTIVLPLTSECGGALRRYADNASASSVWWRHDTDVFRFVHLVQMNQNMKET